MDTTRPSRYQRFLQWAAARKLIIPPETRVDPSPFSEDEFPVFCSKCDYLLRGLPDSRCPECGREFDRGRLLVDQYVTEYGKRSYGARGKWSSRTRLVGTVTMILCLVPLVVVQCVDQYGGSLSQASGSDKLVHVCAFASIAACFVGLVLLMVSGVLIAPLAVRSRRKRRRVLDAVDHDQPDFVAAQRGLWGIPALLLGFGAAFATWYVLSIVFGSSGSRIHPLHLILSMVAGCATTVVIFCVAGCLHRPERP
jgi:hypothetical protein